MYLACLIFVLLPAFINGQELNRLPNNLLMGFASASYQIEGAWNEDGKGENIWDRFTHEHPESIVNGDNGDIASDSYHKWKEDVQLLKDIGAQVYRFSLSWSRILPNGDIATINQPGINYYNNLIDELLKNEIQPLVTIYHWDLPQPLQDLGGWTNPIIIDYYTDFARLVFQTYGDRVKWWATFNEPRNVCHGGYGRLGFAPSINSHGIGEYLCAHHIILSHAKSYRIYEEDFRDTQGGRVGITLDGGWQDPTSDSAEDIEAAEVRMLFEMGWFADPIFKGDYPAVMRERIDTNSKNEGRPRSRLPVFTENEKNLIKGTADFLGINHYTTYLSSPESPQGPDPSWDRDVAVAQTQDPSWPSGAAEWMKVVPEGIRKELVWVKKNYDIPVFITENGYSDFGEVDDIDRISYFNSYLHEILKAIYEDDCNVIGYTAWSLLDSFEWIRGYLERFGLHHIDFNDPHRTRTPKSSVKFFKEILSTRTLPPLNSTQSLFKTRA